MAASNFDRCVGIVLHEEGGFVNNPRDPGGATNMGITLATLRAWRGKPTTVDDVRSLTPAEATAIYRANYWAAVRGNDLPSGVDLTVFDCAVTSGPREAVRILQRSAGAVDDGALGPKTLSSVIAADREMLLRRYADEHYDFIKTLPTFATFGAGWVSRIHRVLAFSLAMA